MNRTMLYRTTLFAWTFVLFMAGAAAPCEIGRPVSPSEMVVKADVIVRVVAVDYAMPPARSDIMTTGVPDSVVRFKVVQVLKGRTVPDEILLNGYLAKRAQPLVIRLATSLGLVGSKRL